MSISLSPMERADIVSRLQAAGCVFAADEVQLLASTARTRSHLAAMVTSRVAGAPLEHVLGWAEFCGLRIEVDPGVFVPRRRTELLAREAIEVTAPGAILVDVCCGSGAVAAAVLAAVRHIEVHAIDIDPAAVACARRNLAKGGGHVYEGDLFEPLPAQLAGRVDVVVANAPYVPTDAIALLPQEARSHERQIALDGGADGLDIQRRLIRDATHWLAPNGHLLVETSRTQAAKTVDAFARAGLSWTMVKSNEVEATIVVGARSAPNP